MKLIDILVIVICGFLGYFFTTSMLDLNKSEVSELRIKVIKLERNIQNLKLQLQICEKYSK